MTLTKGFTGCDANWSLIPEYMRESVDAYISQGRPVGHFLTALLSGDLFEALARADDTNVRWLREYGVFLYNYAPSGCYGSPEKVRAWIELGGLQCGKNRWVVVYREDTASDGTPGDWRCGKTIYFHPEAAQSHAVTVAQSREPRVLTLADWNKERSSS